jgi:hypothetical protein
MSNGGSNAMSTFSELDIDRQNANRELVGSANMIGGAEWWANDGIDVLTDADLAAKGIMRTILDVHCFFYRDGSAKLNVQREGGETVIELPAPIGEQLQTGLFAE